MNYVRFNNTVFSLEGLGATRPPLSSRVDVIQPPNLHFVCHSYCLLAQPAVFRHPNFLEVPVCGIGATHPPHSKALIKLQSILNHCSWLLNCKQLWLLSHLRLLLLKAAYNLWF